MNDLMNAPLATRTCNACGSQVMPALIRCPDCGTPLYKKPLPKKKIPATAAVHAGAAQRDLHASSAPRSPGAYSSQNSLQDMLAMAPPIDASPQQTPSSNGNGQAPYRSFDGRVPTPPLPDSPSSTFDHSIGAAETPQVVTVKCACGKILRARPDQIGKRIRCPACQKPVSIEASTLESSTDWKSLESRRVDSNSYSFEETAKKLPATPVVSHADDTAVETATKKTLSRGQMKKLIAALDINDPASQEEAVARRQALQDLGEAGEASAVEDIIAIVDDPWIPVREAAAAALGAIKDPAATPTLVRMLGDEASSVCRAAITALGHVGDARAVKPLVYLAITQPHRKSHVNETVGMMKAAALPELLKLLKHDDPSVVLESVMMLGHLRERQATDALLPLLNADSTLLQGYAAEALGKIGDAKAVVPLCHAAQSANAGVRAAAVASLSTIGDKRAEKTLMNCLQDQDEVLRYHAVKGLGRIGDKRYLPAIVTLLADPDDRVRGALAETFGEIVEPRCIEPLMHLLQDAIEPVRVKAATSLRKYRDPRLVPFLINGLNDTSETVQLRCIDALGEQKSSDAVTPLVSKLTINRSITTRAAAAKALGEVGDESAVDHLIDALKDEYNVRCKAIVSLGQIASQKSLPALLALLKDGIPEIRYHAAGALAKIDNQYARLAIEKLLEDNSPLVRKCAAKILAERGDAHAAALLKDDFIVKRKPRASVKKMMSGFQISSLTDTLRHASLAAKIASGVSLALVAGVALAFAGVLPTGMLGAGSGVPVLRGNVAHVAFSSDGQQIAMARTRGLLELWKRTEKSPPQQIPLSCQAVCYTPVPNLLLLANANELTTFKLDTPDEPPKSLAKFNSPIQYMASTPDFKFAVTWTADGVARVWNLTTMREAASLQIPVQQNAVIALSPDARTIVSGTQQGTVVIWDTSSRKPLSEIPGLKGSVTALAFSRDGKRLAVGTKNGAYYVWDYATGNALAEWNEPGNVQQIWVDMTAERVVAVSGLSGLKSWTWTDNKMTRFPITDAESYEMLAPSPDGKYLLAAGQSDSPVWMFDIDKAALTETFDVDP